MEIIPFIGLFNLLWAIFIVLILLMQLFIGFPTNTNENRLNLRKNSLLRRNYCHIQESKQSKIFCLYSALTHNTSFMVNFLLLALALSIPLSLTFYYSTKNFKVRVSI